MTPADLEAIRRVVREELDRARQPQPVTPVAGPDRDRAAERLVFALHIYLDSRGPLGCIMDALEAIAPEVAAEVREHDAGEVYGRRWSEGDGR